MYNYSLKIIKKLMDYAREKNMNTNNLYNKIYL